MNAPTLFNYSLAKNFDDVFVLGLYHQWRTQAKLEKMSDDKQSVGAIAPAIKLMGDRPIELVRFSDAV